MEKLLRIAVVTETYPPEINGVAITTGRMAHDLRTRGHFIQVFRPRQSGNHSRKFSANSEDISVPGIKIPVYRDLSFGLPDSRLLENVWQSHPPDIVHVVTEGPLGWSAVRVAKKLSLPVVSDYHTNFHAYSRYYHLEIVQNPVKKYLRYLHNRTDCTLVPTKELQQGLSKQGYRNVKVIGRGIDTSLFSFRQRDNVLRKSWGLTENDTAVLYVGRLAPEKIFSWS